MENIKFLQTILVITQHQSL